jgi:hypothetical protein
MMKQRGFAYAGFLCQRGSAESTGTVTPEDTDGCLQNFRAGSLARAGAVAFDWHAIK